MSFTLPARRQWHPARPHDRGDGGCRPDPAGLSLRRKPDPAGEPRSAARRHRLPGAGELPAGTGRDGRRAHRRTEAARNRPDRRRGAGDQLRLHRAAAGVAGAAAGDRRGRQSEKLDRAARRVHPRDRRRHAALRHDRRRLSRPALCRDQPEDVSGAAARGLAALAGALPHRRCHPHRRRTRRAARSGAAGRCRRCRSRQRRGAERRSLRRERQRLRRLPRQAPYRRGRYRPPRRLRGRRVLGGDRRRGPTAA